MDDMRCTENNFLDNNVSPSTEASTAGGGRETTTTADAEQSASTAQAQQVAEAPDVLTKVREIAGWEVDDDYLKTDYRTLAKSERERAQKLAETFGEEPDELVEVTPNVIRLRKRILDANERKRSNKSNNS
jgi:hypothetical protein